MVRTKGAAGKRTYPVHFRSSPRALWGKTLPRVLWVAVAVAASLFCPAWLASLIWLVAAVALAGIGIQAALQWQRIRNTAYTLHPNRLEETSCLFRFLGVRSNLINLNQLRQLEAFSNSYLDVWFFHCGGVTLTVAGDETDFQIRNVHQPAAVKALLEEACFGGSDGQAGAASRPKPRPKKSRTLDLSS